MKEMKAKAKREMLKKLQEAMGEMGADSIMGGMGVTVEAKDKEGLLEGLDKAEEVIEEDEMTLPEEGMEMSEEDMELPTEDEIDYEEYSKEELIEMLKNK